MKHLLVLLLLVVIATEPASATTVSYGESFEYTFSNLPFFDFFNTINQAGISINLAGDSLDSDEIAKLELFDNNFVDTPFFIGEFIDPNLIATAIIDQWQDLQGAFRLTMLSGSIEIDGFSLQVVRNGERFLQTIQIAAMPLPDELWFFVTGLLVMQRKRKYCVIAQSEKDAKKADPYPTIEQSESGRINQRN